MHRHFGGTGMIGICPKCGDYEWNKQISEDKKYVICQQCGYRWKFKAMPLFILTGFSFGMHYRRFRNKDA